ncbi:hypothetical protein M9Y10_031571 [Tritrichomonas musculus]|uniref:Uncharacterized protein n=1 Tax=Tritrichomonas musculus TaxID=1915356 RepID=A0ABR2H0Y7_9EUKA
MEDSISISDSTETNEDENDPDKPNITVDDKKEVHIRLSDQGETEEGSIVAAPKEFYPSNAAKDPVISHYSESKEVTPGKSKCCILI